MPNVRVMPPPKGDRPQAIVNGRTYVCLVGSYLDVVEPDANVLTSNKWVRVGHVGPTSSRPTTPNKSDAFVDTTLNVVVVWDGMAWRHPFTAASV
jgi:hypothetical protein